MMLGPLMPQLIRHKLDDLRPYLFKTTDFGKSWTKITNGIPEGAYTHAVREDPVRKNLLYAGTETGIYVSFDGGANWQSLQLNLPNTPDPRSDRQERRFGRGHSWPRFLDSRRHHAVASGVVAVHIRGHALQAARHLSPALA